MSRKAREKMSASKLLRYATAIAKYAHDSAEGELKCAVELGFTATKAGVASFRSTVTQMRDKLIVIATTDGIKLPDGRVVKLNEQQADALAYKKVPKLPWSSRGEALNVLDVYGINEAELSALTTPEVSDKKE